MSAVEEQIEDVKQVMLNNVEKIISRGERLEDLRNKTEELEARVMDFSVIHSMHLIVLRTAD